MTKPRLRAAVAVFLLVALTVPAVASSFALAADGPENSTTSAANSTASGTESEWTYEELSPYGTVKSGAPSEAIRPYGNAGSYWMRHVPVQFLADDSNREYATARTLIERPYVYVGSFRGWEADATTQTFHVVVWDFETVTRTTEDNQTVQERVVTNATHTTVEASFPANDYGYAKIPLPEHYGEPKLVTVWLDGHRDDVSWRSRYSVSEAAQSVPIQSQGGIAGFAAVWMFLPCMVTSVGVIALDKRFLRKVGNAPMVSVLEIGFALAAAGFLGLFVFYNGLLELLATAPWSIGIFGGLLLGVAVLFAFSEDAEEVLFLQLSGDDATVAEDGMGRWKTRTRTFEVVETEEGRKIRREGWLPWLAAVWPFYNAAPTIDIDDLGTRFVGGEEDVYDEVFWSDPTADEPIDYSEDGFSFGFPNLLDWPETEDELVAGRWPIPSVAWGPLVGIPLFVGLSYYVSGLLFNQGFGIAFALLAALAVVVRPNAGKAEPNLAPWGYGALIRNLIEHAREFENVADRAYWKDEALTEKADKRAERVRDREDEDRTTFERITDELAPPECQNQRTQPSKEVPADD